MMGLFDIDDEMMMTVLVLDVMIILSLVAFGFAGLSLLSLLRRAASDGRGRRRAVISVALSLAALVWTTLAISAGVRSPPEWPMPLLLSCIRARVGCGLLVEVGQARADQVERHLSRPAVAVFGYARFTSAGGSAELGR